MRFVELFAGIGGFRVGLESAKKSGESRQVGRGYGITNLEGDGQDEQYPSFKCVYANEWDRYSAAIYRYRFGDIDERDIRTVDPRYIPDFDLLTFGWPCQDNSIAGQRAGQVAGSRSGLLTEAVRILRAKRPDYFIAENVPGLFSVAEGTDFYETINLFTDTGYDVQWQVLNTRWFLPQNRERIYFVGHLRGIPRPEVFPIGETGSLNNESDADIAACLQSPGHACGNYKGMTMVIQSGHRTKGNVRLSDGEIPAITQDYGTGGGNVPMIVHENKSGTRTAHDEAMALRSGASHNYQTVQRQPLKFLERNQRNIEGDYAFTVDGANSGGILHGNTIRRLTPIECERLQGFPDGFTKYGKNKNGVTKVMSDTRRYKALGNAVSTPVVREVGRRLLLSLSPIKGQETR